LLLSLVLDTPLKSTIIHVLFVDKLRLSPREQTPIRKTYAHPKIGRQPGRRYRLENVLGVLKPIWSTKTKTAKRVQGRIENILDYAAAYGHPGSDQPGPLAGTPGHPRIPHKEAGR